MPIIFVILVEGRSLDEKRALTRGITDAAVEALKVDPGEVRVILRNIAREDFANGGVLKCDQSLPAGK